MRSLKYLIFAFVFSFIALNNVSAASTTCKYDGSIEGADLTYQCTITDSGISCRFTNSSLNISYKSSNSEGTVSDSSEGTVRKIQRSNFLNSNDEADCNEVSKIMIDIGITSLQEFQIFNIDENISGSIASNANANYITKGTYTFNLANDEESGFNNGQSGGGRTESAGTGSNNDSEFDVDTFCEGSVQGVFTTLGWVFFFLKILIPIILIVFGSIDFGKAMLSSKDDEIKKSAKTLVMRAIAGVIIFFIPTLLNFVVELIGGDDLYNGTFATCTHCMLEPTDDSCKRLIGD